MGILADDIARVRAATDFVAVASEHIALKRVGRRWVGLCPFHTEKSGSFSVNAEEGLYYCFGCGAGGDAIRFVQEVEHLDFADAVERLAARAGIQVHYDTVAVSQERQRRAALLEAMERAVEWYHQRLLTGRDAAPARSYLRSRGYDGDVVRAYRLGWAPDDWDALSKALHVPTDVLHDAGLGRINKIGRQQDEFRARLLFPIFDVRGDAIAFGGRALPGAQGPKYKNSPESHLYAKSRTLYGLNWAKADIVTSGEVVVCEGYTDVIGLASVGRPRAVATCGTALTEDHFRTLKNFARRVVLAYDADAAGQAAAAKFYEWERRFEVDIAVAALPAGADPGSLAQTDPDALRAAIDDARPFLAFRLERATAGADLRTAEGRAKAAEAAMAVVREHPSDLVRDQYVMQVADRVRIPADRLRRLLEGRPPAPAATTNGSTGAPLRPRVERDGPELEALRLAVHYPEQMAPLLHEVLFADPTILAGYRALCRSATLHEAIAGADADSAALLRRLAVEEAISDHDDVMARLAEEAARRAIADLDASARQSSDPMSYARRGDVGWLKLAVKELPAVDATGRLVLWLVDRFEEQQA
ncbi:MAG: primase [Actinomycetota bacterium]|jgi:DNA primase|nr:primase [Actinomycetota bacterium]